MAGSERTVTRNRLLTALDIEDRAALWPKATRISLDMRMILQRPGKAIEAVYFPENAIASVVALGGHDSRAEIGLVGNEGLAGVPVVLGTDRSPHEVFVQVPGSGLRIEADVFRQLMDDRPGIRTSMLHFAQAFLTQVSYTALANVRQKLESRLARWLLMSLDRVEGDELPLTHEFIAIMLGVRRPGVTLAMHILEGRGYIRTSRSRITVIDREGLEESAEGFYGVPETEYRRLIG
ncbi:Crp/Fnr family transcriptional regulator [Kaistia defluvii]|uniref:CRP-like cAMP-binding protein n=1 Tax=Kaistia defluvii TaxID=410841 RepID=A0ABV2R7C5_9HYPH